MALRSYSRVCSPPGSPSLCARFPNEDSISFDNDGEGFLSPLSLSLSLSYHSLLHIYKNKSPRLRELGPAASEAAKEEGSRNLGLAYFLASSVVSAS